MAFLRSAVLVGCALIGGAGVALCQQSSGTTVAAKSAQPLPSGAQIKYIPQSAAGSDQSAKLLMGTRCLATPSAGQYITQTPNATITLVGARASMSYENGLTVVYVGSGTASLTATHGLKQSVTVGGSQVGTIDVDGSARVTSSYGPLCLHRAEVVVGAAGLAGNAALIPYVLLQTPTSPSK